MPTTAFHSFAHMTLDDSGSHLHVHTYRLSKPYEWRNCEGSLRETRSIQCQLHTLTFAPKRGLQKCDLNKIKRTDRTRQKDKNEQWRLTAGSWGLVGVVPGLDDERECALWKKNRDETLAGSVGLRSIRPRPRCTERKILRSRSFNMIDCEYNPVEGYGRRWNSKYKKWGGENVGELLPPPLDRKDFGVRERAKQFRRRRLLKRSTRNFYGLLCTLFFRDPRVENGLTPDSFPSRVSETDVEKHFSVRMWERGDLVGSNICNMSFRSACIWARTRPKQTDKHARSSALFSCPRPIFTYRLALARWIDDDAPAERLFFAFFHCLTVDYFVLQRYVSERKADGRFGRRNGKRRIRISNTKRKKRSFLSLIVGGLSIFRASGRPLSADLCCSLLERKAYQNTQIGQNRKNIARKHRK